MTVEPHRFPLPLHRGRRARRRRRCSPTSPSRRGEDRRERAGLREETGGPVCRRAHPRRRGHGARLPRGGRLFTFGNGGSATDAEAGSRPVRPPGTPSGELPAVCLTDAPAVLTALGQRRRVRPRVRRAPLDRHRTCRRPRARLLHQRRVAQRAARLREVAPRAGLLTIGLAGYDGGAMADERRRRPLPRRSVRERPPHPGSAGRAPRRPASRRAATRSTNEAAP